MIVTMVPRFAFSLLDDFRSLRESRVRLKNTCTRKPSQKS